MSVFRTIFCLQFMLLISLAASAQVLKDNQPQEITIGSEKLVNTHVFNQKSNLNFDMPFGLFILKNSYRGMSTQASSSYFRDEWRSNIKYYYPVLSDIQLCINNSSILFSDTRSVLANEFSRMNFSGGLRYDYVPNAFIEVHGGFENNNQMGVRSGGKILITTGQIKNYNFDDFILNSTLDAEYLKLNDERKNANADFSFNIFREYDSDNSLKLKIDYKNISRDFMSVLPGNISVKQVETRIEDRIQGTVNAKFSMTEHFSGKVNFSADKSGTERFFKTNIIGIANSAVKRNLDAFSLKFDSEARYQFAYLQGLVRISYSTLTENNIVSRKYDIRDHEYEEIKSNEQKQDRIKGRTELYAMTDWRISDKDKINIRSSVSKFTYDTPSELNNDERDELSIRINSKYTHVFSSLLSASLSCNAEILHMVYLKAEHSALNNYNRIFGIKPEINFKSKNWTMNPKLELLANYTAYDFEGVSPGVQSFSLRQISYQDSLCIFLGKMFNLQASLKLRYSERGILYWNSFSESPQMSNSDNFLRLLLVRELQHSTMIGIGIRYYGLTQHSLYPGGGREYRQKSIGPETVFTIYFSSGSSISLRGWYEFQTINSAEINGVPNLLFYTTIRL